LLWSSGQIMSICFLQAIWPIWTRSYLD
jgi:hypothetical protein